jgi:hypothetical protein
MTNIKRQRARKIIVNANACEKWKMNMIGSIKGGKHVFLQYLDIFYHGARNKVRALASILQKIRKMGEFET